MAEAGAAPRESVVGEEIGPAGGENAEEEGRGRRRGRRRRSGGRPGEREEPVRARSEHVTPAREPLAEPEFEDESALDEDETDEVERRPFGDEEDDDDDMSESDPFRDWNVPMWPDLIASLYRPER